MPDEEVNDISSTATPAGSAIAPAVLLERLVAGRPTTLLDVRDDASWCIEAPSVSTLHVPSAQLPDRAPALARDLPADSVVVCSRGVTAQVAAERIRSEGGRVRVLDGGMRGWIGVLRAFPVHIGVPGLTVLQVQRPGRGCLSYLLASGGKALIVDPAPDADFYVALARDVDAKVRDVVDTHLHADHLSGARALAERTGATLRLPQATLERGHARRDEVRLLHDGDVIPLGATELVALALPGHTTDMTGLRIGERALIAGDSLFASGIARPDLQPSDVDGARDMARRLHATLRERILSLLPDTVLLPGHDHPIVRSAAIAPTLAETRRAVPELAIDDPARFTDDLLTDMPPRPANYEEIIAANSGYVPPDPELESGGNSCAAR